MKNKLMLNKYLLLNLKSIKNGKIALYVLFRIDIEVLARIFLIQKSFWDNCTFSIISV